MTVPLPPEGRALVAELKAVVERHRAACAYEVLLNGVAKVAGDLLAPTIEGLGQAEALIKIRAFLGPVADGPPIRPEWSAKPGNA